jgi:hypothetical protein
MSDDDADYAFPHQQVDERRRLDLFADRLDPITIRRVERLGIQRGARCLEVGGEQLIAAGVMSTKQMAELHARINEPDFLGCGFAHIGAWGRRPISRTYL